MVIKIVCVCVSETCLCLPSSFRTNVPSRNGIPLRLGLGCWWVELAVQVFVLRCNYFSHSAIVATVQKLNV